MQYFYLVSVNYDESTSPLKIFLQEREAIKWGRREATKLADDGNYEVTLSRQPITRNGEIEFVRTLEPYKKPIDNILYAAACGIANGSDSDIDKGSSSRYPTER